jgi:hypothetical protein
MKAIYLGLSRSGAVLGSLLVFCTLFFMGCAKEPETKPEETGKASFAFTVKDATIESSSEYSLVCKPGQDGKATIYWNIIVSKGNLTDFKVVFEGLIVSTNLCDSAKVENTSSASKYLEFYGQLDGRPVKASVEVKPQVIVPPTLPTTTLVASRLIIFEGDSVLLSWHNSNSDSSTLTSIPAIFPRETFVIDSVGSIWVKPNESTLFTNNGYNKAGSASSSVTIFVNAPPPLTISVKIDGIWDKMDVLYQATDTGVYESVIGGCEKDDFWIFIKSQNQSDTTNGTFEMHQGPIWCGGTTEIWSSGNYHVLVGSQISLHGAVYKIVELTDTKLVLSCFTSGTFKYVFEKRQKK